MAQKPTPVRVKPNVLSSNALKLITLTPCDGAQRPSELAFATTNNDTVKVQANFKRTPSGDTSELELQYNDFSTWMQALKEASNSSEENIEPVVCVGKSNYVGGQYNPEPNPAGRLIFGRNKGVFWISLVVGTGKPTVQWPLLETTFASLQTASGEPIPKATVSKWSMRGFVNRITKHVGMAMDDRYIPWQHKALIKEGKPTPYSDPKVNYSYINTYNPNGGGNGGGNTAPQQQAPLKFDDDIPF